MPQFLKKPSANGTAATEGETTDVAEPQTRELLGTLLLDAGLLDESQLEEAVREGSETGVRLGEVVVRHGWASEDDVARVLAEQAGLDYLDRASIWFDSSALARLSRDDAMRLEALPVRIEGDHVMVAVAEPTEEKLAELRRLIGEDTVVVVVPKTALDGGIDLLATQPEGAPPPPPPPPKAPPEPAPAPAPPAPPAGPAAAATNGSQSPGALDLAAQARNFADSIAAQAAAMQEAEQRIAAQAAAMEESEQRIAALEGEVAAGRAAMQEAKTQLAAVLRLFESA